LGAVDVVVFRETAGPTALQGEQSFGAVSPVSRIPACGETELPRGGWEQFFLDSSRHSASDKRCPS